MSHKVVRIAAGEAHTLALTEDGRVFSWGRGTFGRLGTGKEEDELIPVPVSFSDDSKKKKEIPSENGEEGRPKFVGIAAGAYHSLALEGIRLVHYRYSWTDPLHLKSQRTDQFGRGATTPLGHSDENTSVPYLIERFHELGSPDSLAEESNTQHENTPLKVLSVKAGGMMSLAIDSTGALWMWGNCPQQSKTDDEEFCFLSSPAPLPVWDFHGHTVVKVACGNEHVVAVVSAGETSARGDLISYSWGNNKHGQLGLGDKESRSRPEVISTFDQESLWAVYEIACGAFHTALLTHKKPFGKEIDSKCWTFGLGENGQLGHGTTNSTCLPEPVDRLPNDALISLDCGLFHTSVVSAAGEVWSWGMEKGLGLCPDASFTGNDAGDALSPLRIQSTETNGGRFAGPVQVACGAAHTVLVAGDGSKLWAWGRGRSGVLGRGETADSFGPCAVKWPPLGEDFKEEGVEMKDGEAKARDVEVGEKSETAEELSFLRRKLTLMERYATVLHVSIFRKPLDERHLPVSLLDSGMFDIGRELENVMESADNDELARMEIFYRKMLAGVKDKLLKRRIQEIVKECLHSPSAGHRPY